MKIDHTGFPIVWMRAASNEDGNDEDVFEALQSLLARERPFVIVHAQELTGHEHQHDQGEMKQASIWMKRHKAALKSFVKASIYIEPSTPRQLSAKAFVVMYENFWGYPLRFAATQTDAVELAHQLLAE